ncbi:MAG: protein translocase SEC61 complex subunit gamma [Thermoproteota archaeon]|nr:MAG: protein translocase SEC61 complex subunit gamma [Candidatus Korarchaeota archaeon]
MEFAEAVRRTLSVSRKPTYQDLWRSFKVTLLGFTVVGVLGFLIQLATTMLAGG